MAYVDQEFLTGADPDIAGDCWRVCIANLLDVPRVLVPHFVQLHDTEWLEATQEWLTAKHRVRLEVTALPADGALFGRTIIIGGSPRGDHGHAVLGDIEGNVLHDPHPSRDGLTHQSLVLKAVAI
jgi:hypothetical protein